MKKILFILLVYILVPNSINAQSKLTSNDLRIWYPLSVKNSTIESQLKEDGFEYEVEEANIYIDGYNHMIRVIIGSPSSNQFPQVQYLIKEDFCVVMNYFDRIENINKWFEILSNDALDNDYTSNIFYGFGLQYRIFLDAKLNIFQVHISNQ